MAPRTRLGLCCHLRVLLRFCHREGITSRDLSGAVGTPPVYRLDDVPRSITWDEVRRMLEQWREGRYFAAFGDLWSTGARGREHQAAQRFQVLAPKGGVRWGR